MAKARESVDPRRILVTPEGVALNLSLALAGQRISALFIDLLIMGGSMIGATIALLSLAIGIGDGGAAKIIGVLWLLGFFFIRNGYFIIMEMGPRAATWGKRAQGLRVVARNGGQLTADAVIVRNLMRELEFFLPVSFLAAGAAEEGLGTLAWLAGLVWVGIFLFFPLFNRDRLRIGDLLAGTWVIHAPKRKLAADLLVSAEADGEGSISFTDAQLGTYGILELQTLEQVLRVQNPESMAAVAATIRTKIGASDWGNDEAFLREYYAALRKRLERGLLLGRRKENKYVS